MNIDEEIHAAEELVFELRQRHNALVLAASAPREILCAVFAYHPVKLDSSSTIARPTTWLALLQVCSHWRQTYIATPTLWNHPGEIWIPEKGKYAEVVLQRASGVPINLELHFRDVGYCRKLPQALPAAVPWLKSLRVSGQDSRLSKLFRALDGSQAPHLEVLEIDLYSDTYDKGHDLRRSRIFAGLAPPSLKILTLHNCIFGWDWPLLNASTITDLDIEGHSAGPSPTFAELLAALSRLIMLERLRLKNCFPAIARRIEVLSNDRVELPKVNLFTLTSASSFALCAVAAHIRVPATARYIIRCVNYSLANVQGIDSVHCRALSEAIQTHVFIDGPQSWIPREDINLDQHLILRGSEDDDDPDDSARFAMEFGTMHYHLEDDLNTPFDFLRRKQKWKPSITLAVSWERDFEENVAYVRRAQLALMSFAAFLAVVPLDDLHAVYIHSDIFRHRAAFAASLARMQSVQALTLAGRSQFGALEAMSGLIDIEEPFSNLPLFPSLKRLCLCNTRGETVLVDGNTVYEHIRAMLQRRMDSDQNTVPGLRVLERLGIAYGEIPVAQVEALGPLLAHGSVDVMTAEDDPDSEDDT